MPVPTTPDKQGGNGLASPFRDPFSLPLPPSTPASPESAYDIKSRLASPLRDPWSVPLPASAPVSPESIHDIKSRMSKANLGDTAVDPSEEVGAEDGDLKSEKSFADGLPNGKAVDNSFGFPMYVYMSDGMRTPVRVDEYPRTPSTAGSFSPPRVRHLRVDEYPRTPSPSNSLSPYRSTLLAAPESIVDAYPRTPSTSNSLSPERSMAARVDAHPGAPCTSNRYSPRLSPLRSPPESPVRSAERFLRSAAPSPSPSSRNSGAASLQSSSGLLGSPARLGKRALRVPGLAPRDVSDGEDGLIGKQAVGDGRRHPEVKLSSGDDPAPEPDI